MAQCILCLDILDEKDLLPLDGEFLDNITPYELIKSHFAFSERILVENLSSYICSECVSQLLTFHDFHTKVAIKYGLIEEIYPDDVKEEQIENTLMDQEDQLAFEECIEDESEVFAVEEVEALEEVVDEPIELFTFELDEKKFEPKPIKARKSANVCIDPADDDKIRRFANMNCEICSKTLESVANARAHFRRDHGVVGYLRCCGRIFKQRNRLLDHVNTTHFNLTYPCGVCGKTFDSKAYLMRHMIYHEERKTFQCDHCPKSFAKKFLVRNHLLTTHIFDRVIPAYACHYEVCDKVFKNEARLKHHLRYTHTSSDAEVCEICSKTFKTKSALDEHTRIHTRRPEDRFRCDICGHFISELKTFKRHLKNHETEGLDNTCHYCGKKAPNLNALKKHIRYVHETEKQYQCRFCDKSFKRLRACDDHEAAVHTHQELYDCEYCGKGFRNQSNMLAHRKKFHPDKYVAPAYLRDS